VPEAASFRRRSADANIEIETAGRVTEILADAADQDVGTEP
jgi:hypothetical protein